MTRRSLLLLLLLLCSCAVVSFSSAHSSSLRVQRHPSALHSDRASEWLRDAAMTDRRTRGQTIPVDGSVLKFGAYYINVLAGTPPTNYQLLLDTGSSNTAIAGPGCTTCNNTAYASSSASVQTCNSSFCLQCAPRGSDCQQCVFGAPYCYTNTSACGFGITYDGGGQGVEGYYVTDKACLGSLCGEIAIGLIERSFPPAALTSSPFNGIVGFASDFNACNPTCVPTILDSLGVDLFSLCLTTNDGGVLDLGLIDTKKANGPIQYTPFEVDRWYNLVVQDVQVGGISLGLSEFVYRTTNDVIGSFIDSGTSTILLNGMIYSAFKEVYQTHYCNLKGVCGGVDNLFAGKCLPKSLLDPLSSYPNFTVVVAGTQPGSTFALDLPADNYLVEVNDVVCLGVQGPQVGVGMVLGDLFMQNFYIVHDLSNKIIGFAPLQPGSCK